MTPHERQVRRRRARAMRADGHTFAEIGKALSVTASRASQLAKSPSIHLPARGPSAGALVRDVIEANARRVDECARCVLLAVGCEEDA